MTEDDERAARADLIGAYALGVLSADDVRLVTAHILTDPAARAEFESLRPVADLIGLSVEQPLDAARSARMKSRLLAAVAAEPSEASTGTKSSVVTPIRPAGTRRALLTGSWFAAAAAIVVALLSTAQNVTLRRDLSAAQTQAASLRHEIAQVDRVRTKDREMVADLLAGNAQRYPVPDGDVVRRGSRAYLTLHALAPLPHGKVYEVWTIAKGAKTPAPSVLFSPSPDGTAIVALPGNAADLGAVALSVEPEGGSKTPTSKPTFVRPLS